MLSASIQISTRTVMQNYTCQNMLPQLWSNLKKISLLILLIFISHNLLAQKVVPVNRSPLTGIALPPGSKQDKRMLSVVGAQMLLDTEGKKNAAVLKKQFSIIYLAAISLSFDFNI